MLYLYTRFEWPYLGASSEQWTHPDNSMEVDQENLELLHILFQEMQLACFHLVIL